MEVYNVLVKLLDGKTATLKFTTPTISGETIKTHLQKITNIPHNQQRLVTGTKQIHDETLIKIPDKDGSTFFTINLLGRLLGGKGGFGSLLRGAGTKAGQKKTDNFDACRDMSGRRLRHVNAEKKLEEWKAEEEERKLEKVAEDFLKKKGKELKKTGNKGDDKYIEKYRQDSEKCMEGVENAVRDAFKNLGEAKRKSIPTTGNSEKRLKLWSVEEDEEDSDSSDDEGDEKSEVLDDGSHEGKLNDGEGSSGSGSVENSGGELSSPGGSTENNRGCFEVGQGSGNSDEIDGLMGPELGGREDIDPEAEIVHVEGNVSVGTESESDIQTVDQSANVSNLEIRNESAGNSVVAEVNGSVEEAAVASEKNSDLEKPLNFDDFNCAADMEVLGMERLKAELQAHGLKCGGALQERASRLFLLKTTPVDKLPKKLLAKK
ncbi:hypothetical protein C5167_047115 [Papaver somniferum]|uniref:Ubiquitin-like domain-containing protein n=1 Tax=Papaver somniferum TaxID=3469 RepID=A0A4Y7LFP7_PAPSO|nr:replication stress response regulator SDE2-like [Papaver somniferum]RZC84334.1 hypothetical protein C5167_047115 [Papaver somniferum]